jgi:hypothetical protein
LARNAAVTLLWAELEAALFLFERCSDTPDHRDPENTYHRQQGDHHEQRRSVFFAIFYGPKFFTVLVFAHRQNFAQQFQRWVVIQGLLFAGCPPHLDTRQNQKRTEDVQQSNGIAVAANLPPKS